MDAHLGGKGGEAVITPGSRDSGQLGSACWLACCRPVGFCNWVWRTDVSLRASGGNNTIQVLSDWLALGTANTFLFFF